MTLTCPHKTRGSDCSSCVVQMIESAVKVEQTKIEKLREALDDALISLTAVAGHIIQPMMAADARAKIVIIKQAIGDTGNLGGPAANIEPQSNTSRQNADSKEGK